MPKVFKDDAERLQANIDRLHTQKLANHCNAYNKKVKAEVEKPHCYKKFRDNFMKLVAGLDTYTDKTYKKHIGFCTVEEVYEAFEYGAEFCICEHKIKVVAMVRYMNPKNLKEFVFNVGSSCIINATNDILASELKEQLDINKQKAYTCKYCDKVCLTEKGRAEKNFDLKGHQCERCSKKHWCRACQKKETPEVWMSLCKGCWTDRMNAIKCIPYPNQGGPAIPVV